MEILKRPLMTEKSTKGNEKGVYTFEVHRKANKIEIGKAITEMYGVSVDEVRTMIVRGKTKTRYTKRGFVSGSKPTYKKAIVKLAEGEFIDLYGELAQ